MIQSDERSSGIVPLKVRDNEPGSISVSAQDGGHVSFKIVKQTRMGYTDMTFEVSLEPNELLHIISQNRPFPEVASDGMDGHEIGY